MKKSNIDIFIKLISVGLILCSFLSYVYAPMKWLFLIGVLLLQVVLFVHADVFTAQEKGSVKWKTYRFLIYFVACVCLGITCVMLLQGSESKRVDHVSILICFVMLVFGNYAPKIPYNRTLGLRLPWTLQHEATWKYAHRILGWCSFPCALFYVLGNVMNLPELSFLALCLWFLIPAILSYRYDQTRRSQTL